MIAAILDECHYGFQYPLSEDIGAQHADVYVNSSGGIQCSHRSSLQLQRPAIKLQIASGGDHHESSVMHVIEVSFFSSFSTDCMAAQDPSKVAVIVCTIKLSKSKVQGCT